MGKRGSSTERQEERSSPHSIGNSGLKGKVVSGGGGLSHRRFRWLFAWSLGWGVLGKRGSSTQRQEDQSGPHSIWNSCLKRKVVSGGRSLSSDVLLTVWVVSGWGVLASEVHLDMRQEEQSGPHSAGNRGLKRKMVSDVGSLSHQQFHWLSAWSLGCCWGLTCGKPHKPSWSVKQRMGPKCQMLVHHVCVFSSL